MHPCLLTKEQTLAYTPERRLVHTHRLFAESLNAGVNRIRKPDDEAVEIAYSERPFPLLVELAQEAQARTPELHELGSVGPHVELGGEDARRPPGGSGGQAVPLEDHDPAHAGPPAHDRHRQPD